GLTAVQSDSVITLALLLDHDGRHEDALERLQQAVQVARTLPPVRPLLRGLLNLSGLLAEADRWLESRTLADEGLKLSRGNEGYWADYFRVNASWAATFLGDWNPAMTLTNQASDSGSLDDVHVRLVDSWGPRRWLLVQRGELEQAQRIHDTCRRDVD